MRASRMVAHVRRKLDSSTRVARGRSDIGLVLRHIGRASFPSVFVFFPSFDLDPFIPAGMNFVCSFNFCRTTSPLIDPGFHRDDLA